jgi:replicative DNA helicase
MSNQAPKMPPHSIEDEQSVLGALLRDNDAVDRLGDLRESKAMLDRASPRLEQLAEARMRAERNQA